MPEPGKKNSAHYKRISKLLREINKDRKAMVRSDGKAIRTWRTASSKISMQYPKTGVPTVKMSW